MKRTGLLETLAVALLACGFVGCVDVTDGTPPGSANVIAFSSPATSCAAVNSANDIEDYLVWGWYDVPTDEAVSGGIEVFNASTVDKATGNTDVTRYWIANKTYDFYSLHPASLKEKASCSSHGTMVVEDFDASKMGTEAIDLMTASAPGIECPEGGYGPVSLTFNHELAKVTVAIQAQQGVTATVTDVKLYGIHTSGTFQCGLKDNPGVVWSLGNTPVDAAGTPYENSDSHHVDGDATTEDGNRAEILAILSIPQDVTGATLSIAYTQNGEMIGPKEILLKNGGFAKWESGQSYNYVLNITPNGITFSGFKVDNWEESHSGGDINIGN